MMHDHDPDHDRSRARRGWVPWFLIAALLVVAVLVVWLWPSIPPDDRPRFVYLAILGFFVGAGVLWSLARAPLGRTVRQAGVWILIGAVLFVGYSFRDEAQYVLDRVQGDLVEGRGYDVTDREISFRAGPNGHVSVEVEIEGAVLLMLVDTGASDVVLNHADARALGLDPDTLDYTLAYNTANGVVMGAPVVLDWVRVGPVMVERVRASVNAAPLNRSLLGMSFLTKTGGYQLRDGVFTLHAP
tara:strand:- start:4341 stop:5069 length:729 start_codon:yes stop_codon:yes gene_type:complete